VEARKPAEVLVVLWIIPTILLPFFGVWVYLLVRVLVDDLVLSRHGSPGTAHD
jgi:hypothetical protein